MGKDAHEDGDCCHACERFASTPAAPIERPVLAASQAGELVLQITERGLPVKTYVPTTRTVRIGRTKDNDIALPSGAVSKRQLSITLRDDGVFVEDLHSSCGTYLDGRHTNGPVRVGDGSIISFANYDLRVVHR